MSRTIKEIDEARVVITNMKHEYESAMLDVLDNDLTEDQIESRYYSEQVVWEEQAALKVREYLDGHIESDEIF